MSAAIRIDLSELKALDGRLLAKARQLEDLTPLMDQIGQAMETTTHERFEGESGPDGVPWQKSKKKTGKTLTEGGFLDDSITHKAGSDSVEIGTNKIYAGIHQFGGTIDLEGGNAFGLGLSFTRQITMPARPFLGIGGDDELTIGELAGDFLIERLAA